MLDPEVEGIVDRIQGLNRRFHRALDETLAEFKLDYAEWKLLGLLYREAEVYRSSPGRLARLMELSSGAITNRLDRLEEAGFLRRLPDPDDRRGILVGVAAGGNPGYGEAGGGQGRKGAFFASALRQGQQE